MNFHGFYSSMGNNTNVEQISKILGCLPWILVEILKMASNGYQYEWYLRFWISSIVIIDTLIFKNYFGYQRCWYLIQISALVIRLGF